MLSKVNQNWNKAKNFTWVEFWGSGFYTGYAPVASGTFGTLPAVFIYLIIGFLFSHYAGWVMFWLSFFFFLPGVFWSEQLEQLSMREDPGHVVIDEMVGFWVTVSFMPFSWQTALVGFFVFRTMDVLKPFPAYQSQKLRNGWGIMVDDVIAGMFANTITRIVMLFI